MNMDMSMNEIKEIIETFLNAGVGAFLILGFVILIVLAFLIVLIIAEVNLFKKAGKNGWEAIIPFYNTYVLIEISGLNWWYFLIAISTNILNVLNVDDLTTITSIASMVVTGFCFYNIAKKMHKNPVGYGIAAAFVSPIIILILGFSKDEFDQNVLVSKNGPIDDNNINTANNNNKTEKYCLNCGQKVSYDTKFCTNCGKEIK